MRSPVVSIVAATLLLTACAPGAGQPEDAAPEADVASASEETDMSELRDFAERYAAAWSSQDAASVAAFHAEDGSLTVNDGEPAVGRAGITASAQGFMTAFPDMQVLLDRIELDGDDVLFHWTLIGTNTGPGGTGNRVRISGYERWTMGDDGLIARSLGHYDADEYARQLAEGVE